MPVFAGRLFRNPNHFESEILIVSIGKGHRPEGTECMRIILYTGKGGVGKTSVAAATALASARRGRKTLVTSTDPAHSLGDSFDRGLSNEPAEICENLWAQEIDSTHEIEKDWGQIKAYLLRLFSSQNVDRITAEELIAFPGMEDLLSLLRIMEYYKEGRYDAVIIDCAPTGETLSLLSYPEMMKWWMERIFPLSKKVVKVLRPVSEPVLGIELPSGSVMDDLSRLYSHLDYMKKILSDHDVTSVRIVVNPEKMVIKEAQRSFTYLNLYDFNVDAVVVNKIIPDGVDYGYLQAWREMQTRYRRMIDESFAPVPRLEVPLFPTETVGEPALWDIAEALFGESDPTAIRYQKKAQNLYREDGRLILSLAIPFTEKDKVALDQKGDELIVKAGSVKRYVTLPKSCLARRIEGAKLEDGSLEILFGDE